MTRLLVLAALLVVLWIGLELLWRWGKRRLREALGVPRAGRGGSPGARPGGARTIRGRLVRCAACGLAVPEERALAGSRQGSTTFFCSEGCRGRARDLAGLG